MNLPTPRLLHGDVSSDQLASAFNQFQTETIACLASLASASAAVKYDVAFTCDAVGTATVAVKTGLKGVAGHVIPTQVQPTDGTANSAVWSWDWTNTSGADVLVSFFGLVASTPYVCRLFILPE